MPTPAGGHAVHHVRRPQLDVVLRQRFYEFCAQFPVLLVAPGTLRAVRVDDHRDSGLWRGGGGDLGEVRNPVEEFLGQIHPHHRTQLAALQRHQDQ